MKAKKKISEWFDSQMLYIEISKRHHWKTHTVMIIAELICKKKYPVHQKLMRTLLDLMTHLYVPYHFHAVIEMAYSHSAGGLSAH